MVLFSFPQCPQYECVKVQMIKKMLVFSRPKKEERNSIHNFVYGITRKSALANWNIGGVEIASISKLTNVIQWIFHKLSFNRISLVNNLELDWKEQRAVLVKWLFTACRCRLIWICSVLPFHYFMELMIIFGANYQWQQ